MISNRAKASHWDIVQQDRPRGNKTVTMYNIRHRHNDEYMINWTLKRETAERKIEDMIDQRLALLNSI